MKEIQFTPKYSPDLPPRPNKNVYILLERFFKYKNSEIDDLTEEEFLERESLNDVYKALENNDKELICLLSDLEAAAVLSKNDNLFAACLFLTAEIIGPDLKNIYRMIIAKNIDLVTAEREIETINVSEEIEEFLKEILRKIDTYFYDLRIREKI